MNNPDKIVVLGHAAVAQEICRLALAMGHQPTSLDPAPHPLPEEPWVHGVAWASSERAPLTSLLPSTAFTLVDALDLNDAPHARSGAALRADMLAHPGPHPPASLVRLLALDHTAEQAARILSGLQEIATDSVVMRVPPIAPVAPPYLPRQADTPLPLEIVAICALRAALEPEVRGLLEPEDIAHLGDAMFLQ